MDSWFIPTKIDLKCVKQKEQPKKEQPKKEQPKKETKITLTNYEKFMLNVPHL